MKPTLVAIIMIALVCISAATIFQFGMVSKIERDGEYKVWFMEYTVVKKR